MKFTAVVVIYNTPIQSSNTIVSLKAIAKDVDFSDFELVVYDNSSEEQALGENFPFKTTYVHNTENGGLADAYNYALNKCVKDNTEWLLLLDHDTKLTKEYFQEIKLKLPQIQENKNIAAIIPKIICNDTLISPAILRAGGFLKKTKPHMQGELSDNITGINSGTLLNIKFIRSLGGFNNTFKVDMLDYWYFHRIYNTRKKVYLLNSILEHSLSVMNYDEVSEKRYANIIQSEVEFFKNYCSVGNYLIFKFRLLLRLLKQIVLIKNKNISKITMKYFLKW